MRFIGDVHGKYRRYKKLIDEVPESIQVGDMGVGFFHETTGGPRPNPPYEHMTRGNHRFIRGNHDNPSVCRSHSQWIYDGYNETSPLGNVSMFIGGANSIDIPWRVEHYSWWRDEELSINELNSLVDSYLKIKPDIMVTHDCPESVSDTLFLDKGKMNIPSQTRQAFQVMFEIHKPKIWIFGHWHTSKDQVIDSTRFICLAELQHIDLEV